MLRPLLSLSVLLACLFGCADPRFSTPGAVAAAPAPVRDREAEELDILESVYRYQFEHNSSGRDLSRLDYLFLARGECQREYKDPSTELLGRFARRQPPVEAWSSRVQEWHGVTYGDKAGKGIIFYIGRIRWTDEDTIEVDGGHDYASRNASGNTYRVERREGAWAVVSAKHNWQS